MSKCSNCEAPNRQLWPPISGLPELEEVKVGNWIKLLECENCNVLWCEVPYEPYAAFKYLVIWDFTKRDWIELHSMDDGEILRKWHSQQIRLLWENLSKEEKKTVKHHRIRSYGLNPIDKEKKEEIIDLKKLISTL